MERPFRLVIADDHRLFRQGLKSLLKSEPEVTVVGETDHVGELAALLAATPCDLLLLDLQMERSVLSDIGTISARVPVIVLTASEVPADAVAALRSGARAVVFKRFAVETLMDAIRTVAADDVWMPPSLQTHMAAQLRSPGTGALSPREEDVLRHVAMGLRNAEIGEKLSISEETVKTHLNRIFKKLGVRDRVELALHAARGGAPRSGRK
jgi:DNA-binding NarL/FixJ family response regulator